MKGEVRACIVCGGRDLTLPQLPERVPHQLLSGDYFCRKCQKNTQTVIFESEEEYQKFLRLKKEREEG
ncbi:hypothetical protein ACFLRC_01560 [Candidatus Altiarchaeota archaeon]